MQSIKQINRKWKLTQSAIKDKNGKLDVARKRSYQETMNGVGYCSNLYNKTMNGVGYCSNLYNKMMNGVGYCINLYNKTGDSDRLVT